MGKKYKTFSRTLGLPRIKRSKVLDEEEGVYYPIKDIGVHQFDIFPSKKAIRKLSSKELFEVYEKAIAFGLDIEPPFSLKEVREKFPGNMVVKVGREILRISGLIERGTIKDFLRGRREEESKES